MKNEFFGMVDQRAVLRLGRAMAALLDHDLRYSYYGRTVGLVGPEDGDMDRLTNLATVQGNTNYGAVPSHQVEALKAAMQARGLVPMRYTKWKGGGFYRCRGPARHRNPVAAPGPELDACGWIYSGSPDGIDGRDGLGVRCLAPCGRGSARSLPPRCLFARRGSRGQCGCLRRVLGIRAPGSCHIRTTGLVGNAGHRSRKAWSRAVPYPWGP